MHYFKPLQSSATPGQVEPTKVNPVLSGAESIPQPQKELVTPQDLTSPLNNNTENAEQAADLDTEKLIVATSQTMKQDSRSSAVPTTPPNAMSMETKIKPTQNSTPTNTGAVPASSQASVTSNTPAKPRPAEPKKEAPSDAQPVQWNIASAKAAYRDEKLTKAEYKVIVNQLEKEYDDKIRDLKLKYRANEIDKATYNAEVQKAKKIYSGK